MPDADRERLLAERCTAWTGDDWQAKRGLAILHRLVPAPDHGRGFRRDPETSFVYYSSEWLSDAPRLATQRCVFCGRMIDPAVRYFATDGKPRHMLCEPSE